MNEEKPHGWLKREAAECESILTVKAKLAERQGDEDQARKFRKLAELVAIFNREDRQP